MELNQFVNNFKEQVENEDITSSTTFKNLESWSSLAALSIIAMVDDEYDVTIGAKEILSANTVEDLYKIIISKK